MSTETIYPTSVSSPGGAGGGSCSGSDTARSCTATSNCDDGLQKSTADHNFSTNGTYPAYRSAASLKVSWYKNKQFAASDNCSATEMRLLYSINSGGAYVSLSGFPKSGSGSNSSGTVTFGLSSSLDISKVRVRINVQATAPSCPTGACCYGPSACECRIDTETACGSTRYQGDGTNCSGDPCYDPAECDPPLP